MAKEKFLIIEWCNDVIMMSTPCYAKNKESVKRTSIYKKALMNKSFDTVLEIKEVKQIK